MGRLKKREIEEIWKTHPIYTDYAISDRGRVKRISLGPNNTKPGKILNPTKDDHDYYQIGLYLNKIQRCFKIHRLVLETFVGFKPKGKQCNHKDGVKANNFLSNLEWITPSENTIHAFENGLKNPVKGEKVGTSKLKNSEVFQIKQLLFEGKLTLTKIGKMFNVSTAMISCIKLEKFWKHI